MWRSTAHSSSTSRKSDTTWSTPRPAAATPAAIPASSAAEAVRLGVFSPVEERWLSVREVEKPTAPAATASVARAAMAAISAPVASTSARARSPMAWTRRAPWGT